MHQRPTSVPRIVQPDRRHLRLDTERAPVVADGVRVIWAASLKAAGDLVEKFKTGKYDLSVYEQAKDIAAQIGGVGPIGSLQGKRLSFAGMGDRGAAKIATASPDGTKALATSGTVVVQKTFQGDPIALGRPGRLIARCRAGAKRRPAIRLPRAVGANESCVGRRRRCG